MKRGKDDEKIMGPMFPRLHVNDTEKGGPRAPPRNKMALYEQLSIPSQRYNSGAMALDPNHNRSLVSSTSANQGTSHDRNIYFPRYGSLSNQQAHVENRKKPVEEDECTVPTFSHSGIRQDNGKTRRSLDGDKHTYHGSNHPITFPRTGDVETNQNDIGDLISKHHVINQDGRDSRVSEASRRFSDISTRENDGVQRDYTSPKYNPRTGFGYSGANEIDNGMQMIEGDHLLERENIDGGDDILETSMVNSVSGLSISPDDVVGIIGQKHFWKARNAIANQQRVFAIQVYELHRLMKVQRLIAGSQHLLLDGSAFLGKSSLKSGNAVKNLALGTKQMDNSQKPTDQMENTPENAVLEAPVSCQDPKMNPWSIHQPAPHHQWLVPVMSPSEGLVYKPYPPPGFMGGPVCGGPMNHPAYHHQDMYFGGQPYFPTFGMPIMNPGMSGSDVDQMNPSSGPKPHGPMGHPPKESELQGSTGSSFIERRQRSGRDALPLFPNIEISEGNHSMEKASRVIRVVPHNPGSTRESVARIFQSIQDERRQYESC